MKKCTVCGTLLHDEVKFCSTCGTECEAIEKTPAGEKTEVAAAAPEASAQNSAAVAVEEKPCNNAETVVPASYTAQNTSGSDVIKKKFNPLAVVIPLILLVAACALVFVIVKMDIFGGSGSKQSSAYGGAAYIKNGDLYYKKVGSDEPVLLVKDYIVDKYKQGNEYDGQYYLNISSDGNTVFYPEKNGADYPEGMAVYCHRNGVEEDIKLDSDINNLQIVGNGKKAFYTKGTDGKFYYSDLNDKLRISAYVTSWFISEDGKKVAFSTYDDKTEKDTSYFWTEGSDAVKLLDNGYITQVTPDLSRIYLSSEDAIYLSENGQSPVKLFDDASYILSLCDDGSFYYARDISEEIPLINFVEDDMKDADAKLKKPTEPDYPSIWTYDDVEEYNAAKKIYDAEYNKYKEALNEYRAKVKRDELRKSLEAEYYYSNAEKLYYYDGSSSFAISDNVYSILAVCRNKPVVLYTLNVLDKTRNIKISEISSVDEAYDIAYGKYSPEIDEPTVVYIAFGSEVSETDISEGIFDGMRFDEDGTALYTMGDVNEEDVCTNLYRTDIVDGKLSERTLVSKNTNTYWVTNNNTVISLENYSDECVDFTVNGKCIDYEVDAYNVVVMKDGSAMYMADCDSNGVGSLMYYRNGKSEKIADNVYRFAYLGNGKVAYIKDYNQKRLRGDMFIFDGKKSLQADEDVSAIIPFIYGTGDEYAWEY